MKSRRRLRIYCFGINKYEFKQLYVGMLVIPEMHQKLLDLNNHDSNYQKKVVERLDARLEHMAMAEGL